MEVVGGEKHTAGSTVNPMLRSDSILDDLMLLLLLEDRVAHTIIWLQQQRHREWKSGEFPLVLRV